MKFLFPTLQLSYWSDFLSLFIIYLKVDAISSLHLHWFLVLDADFVPPAESGSSISAGAVVGIVAAVALLLLLVLGVLWWKGCLRRNNTMEQGTYKAVSENPNITN